MSITKNTTMKGMEVDIKKLFQPLEESKEQRDEHARVTETTKFKIDVIQHSILQLLEKNPHGLTSSNDYDHHQR